MAANAHLRCVIVGGGQAAVQTAVSLRQRGFAGELTLVADEPGLPYQRPPLSKAFLSGALARERLAFRPAALYEKLEIELRTGARAERVDRARSVLALADGSEFGYDRLVLATGTRPRALPIPGADLPEVASLRTANDAQRIGSWLSPGKRLAIVGGGYIGLEVAAVATAAGAQVTILEAADRLLNRVTGPEVSAFFAELHRGRGVDAVLGAGVEAFAPAPDGGIRVSYDGDRHVDVDGVVVAVGVVPAVELALEAGLECDNGIVVDDHCRTSDPLILAAGDCTNHPNGRLSRRLRLESVHNAVEQAKTVAATICDESEPYTQVPWFWSDQYELKLQSVGLSAGHERTVVHGSVADASFSVYYLKGDAVIALDTVNMPREFARARAVFAAGDGTEMPAIEAFPMLITKEG